LIGATAVSCGEATAVSYGETLATFNVKHYAVIAGLTTVQPY
jgi:predicted nucleic acid-binding protein